MNKEEFLNEINKLGLKLTDDSKIKRNKAYQHWSSLKNKWSKSI